MHLLSHRRGSRFINVEHSEVSTLVSDFQTCLLLVAYSSRVRRDCVTSPIFNVNSGQENIIFQHPCPLCRTIMQPYCSDWNLFSTRVKRFGLYPGINLNEVVKKSSRI